MIDRIARDPRLLLLAFVVSALLGAGIFAGLQASFASGPADKAQIESVVRGYLLAHPEILPEAMQKLQEREMAERQTASDAGLAQHAAEVARPFSGAWTGNPNGDITVVAFMDYNCGYCRASLPGLAELVRRDPKVRIVYREYPVLGDDSVVKARWALAAAEQGKFKAFHDALYADGDLEAAITAAGLDRAAAERTISATGIAGEISSNRRLGDALRLTGTPGFVVGKRVYHGALDYPALAQAVADARAGK